MRHLVLALGLIALLARPGAAFEAEAVHDFGPESAVQISVIGANDLPAIAPVLSAFVGAQPGYRVHYVQAASTEIFRAIHDDRAPLDLVLSSAMDLQMRLVNDGFAANVPDVGGHLPGWQHWRDQLFGIALEPVITLVSRRGLHGLPLPRTRRDLIAMLRENPERFTGRIAAYDPARSGVGYFLLSQDDQYFEGFWRLAEVMGRLNVRQECCSDDMIAQLRAGEVLIAYNVVSSYVSRFAPDDPDLVRLSFEDYTLALLRTALIPRNAANLQAGAELLRHILSAPMQRVIAELSGTPLLEAGGAASAAHLRPIRLDAGLLAYGDQLRRAGALNEWAAAMSQPDQAPEPDHHAPQ